VRPPSRRANLDAGPQYYWERQDLNFGEEPDEQNQDHAWYCEHRFRLATAAADPPGASRVPRVSGSSEMECSRCWTKCVVEPAGAGKRRRGRYEAHGAGNEESDEEEEEVKESRGRRTRADSGAARKLSLVDRDGDVAMMDGEDTAGRDAVWRDDGSGRASAGSSPAWECKRCGIVVCESCKTREGSGAARAK